MSRCGQDCGCGPCAEGALYSAGYGAGAQGTQFLPNFTTPGSVRAYKEHLTPIVLATEHSAYACKTLAPADLAAFIAWKAGWDTFYAADDAWLFAFGTAALYSEAQAYDAELTHWREKIQAVGCAPAGVNPESPGAGGLTLATGLTLGAGAAVLLFLVLKR